ncbi:MAG: InlB B-repeat-containing protein [Eggerthellaceae bacterium]|nr:InlB B-repeat-containing protein [Eggerthellaceae bacterium]
MAALLCAVVFAAPAVSFADEPSGKPAEGTTTTVTTPSDSPAPVEGVDPSTPGKAGIADNPVDEQIVDNGENIDISAGNDEIVTSNTAPGESADNDAPTSDETNLLTTASNSGITVHYTVNFDVAGTPQTYYDSSTRYGYVEHTFTDTAGTWADGNSNHSFTGTITIDNVDAWSYKPFAIPVTTYSTSDVSNPKYTLRQWAIASWACEEVKPSASSSEYYSGTVMYYTPGSSMEMPSSWLGASTSFYVYSRDASSAQNLWNIYVSRGGDASHPPSSDAEYIAWADSISGGGGSIRCSWEDVGMNILRMGDTIHLTLNMVPEWCPAVTFDSNGGEGALLGRYGYAASDVELQINKAMDIYTPQASLTRAGYVQTGWNTKANGSGDHYAALQPLKSFTNLTLYAEWDANAHYSVVYQMGSADSGSLPSSSGVSEDGTYAIIQPNDLVRDGYRANGWNTKSDGSGTHYTESERVDLTSNLVLLPDWIKTSYTVYFYANGGAGSMDSMSMTFGTPKALTKNKFSRGGYDFVGWSPLSSATVAIYTDGQTVNNISTSGSAYLYAIWRPISITVSYNADGGSGDYASTSGLSASDVITLPSAMPSKPGSLFEGWFYEKQGTDEVLRASSGITAGEVAGLSSEAAYTLTAHWAEVPFSITYNFNGATGGVVPAKLAIAGSGQRTVAPNTLTRDGATAAGWNTKADGSGTPYAGGEMLELGSDLTLYAQFRDASGALLAAAGDADSTTGYTVSYNLNGGGGSLVDNGAISADGLTAILASNSMTRAGYQANGWNTQADGNGTAYAGAETVSLNGNLVLYAAWKAVQADEPTTGGETGGTSGESGEGDKKPATEGESTNPGGSGSKPQQESGASSAGNGSAQPSESGAATPIEGNGAGTVSSIPAEIMRTMSALAAMTGTGIAPLAVASAATPSVDVLGGLSRSADALLTWLSSATAPEKAYADSGELAGTQQPSKPATETAANDSGSGLLLWLVGAAAVIALVGLFLLLFKRKKNSSADES